MRRSTLRCRVALMLPIGAALVAGCGGGSDAPPAAAPSSPPAAASTSTSAAAASPGAAPASPAASPASPAVTSAGTAPPASSVAPGVDNGVSDLPATQVLERAREVSSRTDSVRIRGDLRDQTRSGTLDVRLSGRNCAGEVTSPSKFSMVLLGPDLYLRGDDAFWSRVSPQAATLLRGKWLKAPSAQPQFANLVRFCDANSLKGSLLGGNPELTKGEPTEIAGTPTVPLKGKEGTLYVATQGEPYPLRVEPQTGQQSLGRINFSEWGTVAAITAPPADQVVDVSALRPGG